MYRNNVLPLLENQNIERLIISINGSESSVLFGLIQLIKDSMSARVVGERKVVSSVIRLR